MLFAGRNGRGEYAHDTDLNNLGPRVGFAYRPTDSVVIRAGYGVNYNGAYARAVPFTQFWTFSRTLDINSPDAGFTPAFILSDGLPAVDPFTEEDRVGSFGALGYFRRRGAIASYGIAGGSAAVRPPVLPDRNRPEALALWATPDLRGPTA